MEIFGGDHILGIFGRKKNRECSRKKKLREGENYLEEKNQGMKVPHFFQVTS